MSGTVTEPAVQVDQWLSSFEDALARGDAAAASELFLDDSYWRDLVALTWNLKTVEGPEGVKDMLEATLASAKPRGFATTEPPAEADGVTDAWFEFETETGRGHGLLRLKDGKAWTHADRAARAQGLRGAARRRAPARRRARRRPRPRDLAGGPPPRGRGARAHAPALRRDHRRRPGRDRARRAAAPARRPDDHRRAQRAPRRLLAQALQVALPARPGLVRPPAVHQVPRELARVLAQGQDRRLAGDVHAGDGAQLLELHDRQEREVRRGEAASGS